MCMLMFVDMFVCVKVCMCIVVKHLKKVHRIISSVMFSGSLQVSGLLTSYLLSQVTLPKLLFQPAILL